MKRQDFVTFLRGAPAWVATARAQELRHVIGHLGAFPKPTGSFDATMPGALAAHHQGLRETGFVEGRDISIEYRWADGHYDRLPSLAAEW